MICNLALPDSSQPLAVVVVLCSAFFLRCSVELPGITCDGSSGAAKVLLSSSTYHLAHCSLVHLFLSLTYTVREQWTVFHVAEFL